MPQSYEGKVSPNVVPASFSPKPEDFAPQITQQLRSNQSHWAQSYADAQINYLEMQLHMAHFRRAVYRLDDGYTEGHANMLLEQDIKVAKTAKTIMMDRISEWAGTHQEQDFKNRVLPQVWEGFVREVRGEPAPEEPAEEPEAVVVSPTPKDQFGQTPEDPEDALAPEEELEPAVVLPSARYDDLASQPKSDVEPPKEVTLGDVLAQIEEANKTDE